MKLYDVIDNHRHLYLVTEKCEGKMLHTVVKEFNDTGNCRKNLPEQMCAKIFYQIMKGMQHFHSLNISHRDIKLENILVDASSLNFETKIIDFGFAVKSQSESSKQTAVCGTPAYMSPQLCAR